MEGETDYSIPVNEVLTSGYIQKRLSRTHNWKRKWMVLRSSQLSYYKDDKERRALKVIPISDILSVSIVKDHHSNHFAIYTSKKVIHLKTALEKEMQTWISQLKKILDINDVEEDGKKTHNDISNIQQKGKDAEIQAGTEKDTDLPNADLTIKSPNTNYIPNSGSRSGSESGPSRAIRSTAVTSFNHTDVEYSGAEDAFASSGISDASINEEACFDPPPNIPEEEENDDGNDSDFFPDINAEELKKPPLVNPNSVKSVACRTSISDSKNSHEEEYINDGYLLRLRKTYNQWKRFYIVLTNKTMTFYRNMEDEYPVKIIKIDEILDVIELDPISNTKIWCLLIITPSRRVRFCAPNEEEMIQWLASIKMLVNRRNEQKNVTNKQTIK